MFPFLKKEDKNYEVFTKSKLVDKTLHRINQRGFLIPYMRGINKHVCVEKSISWRKKIEEKRVTKLKDSTNL